MTEPWTLAELIGPWEPSRFESGLITRCRDAWTKPIGRLSRQELATLLRQKIAIEHLLPIAKRRIKQEIDDGTEMYDGELAAAIEYLEKA
jgi:hypothetical protein